MEIKTRGKRTYEENVKLLLELPRDYYANGVKLGDIFFYKYATGEVINLYKDKYGKIKVRSTKTIKVGGNGYRQKRIIGTMIFLYEHVIAAAALGLYDDIENFRNVQINHKNGNVTNNRADNLEVVTIKENARHREAMNILKERGLWSDDYFLSAKDAIYMLDNEIIYNYTLEQMLDKELLREVI